MLANAGHVRVRVSPKTLVIEYVRSFLPGDGDNDATADQYTIGLPDEPDQSARGEMPALVLRIAPNPGRGRTVFTFEGGGAKAEESADLRIDDLAGRLCAHMHPPARGVFAWDQHDDRGRAVAAGVYHCVAIAGGERAVGRVVVAR